LRSRPVVWSWAWAAGLAFVAVAAAFVLRHAGPVAQSPLASATPSAAITPSAGPGSAERPPLDVLARVEPPPYVPVVVRGGGEMPAFTRAMERYVRGDYAGAASGLRVALREDPRSPQARFYLGASELLAGRADEAIAELRPLTRDPEYEDAARYYIAKAHLARRDVAAARTELQRLARGDGDHKEEAQRLLRQLGTEP
jgi:hypothetical protein